MATILQERLHALARASNLIRPGVAEDGSGEGTTMEKLIRTVLLPYVDEARAQDRECIILSGPAVPVSGHAVTGLALVLHETATNSAKYGALSSPEGCIRVDWSLKEGDVHLQWQESGGPAVTGPPDAKGFGSDLVRRSIAGQLQGSVEYDWRPEGLAVHMSLPLERLRP